MAKQKKDLNGPVTQWQTLALYKWTRRDFRTDVASRKMTYGDMYELIGQVIKVAKAQNVSAAGSEAERLLANFPAA